MVTDAERSVFVIGPWPLAVLRLSVIGRIALRVPGRMI